MIRMNTCERRNTLKTYEPYIYDAHVNNTCIYFLLFYLSGCKLGSKKVKIWRHLRLSKERWRRYFVVRIWLPLVLVMSGYLCRDKCQADFSSLLGTWRLSTCITWNTKLTNQNWQPKHDTFPSNVLSENLSILSFFISLVSLFVCRNLRMSVTIPTSYIQKCETRWICINILCIVHSWSYCLFMNIMLMSVWRLWWRGSLVTFFARIPCRFRTYMLAHRQQTLNTTWCKLMMQYDRKVDRLRKNVWGSWWEKMEEECTHAYNYAGIYEHIC